MAEEKFFEVKGKFIENGIEKKFSKVVKAMNENTAKEKVVCLFGSKHKIKRRYIFIEELKEMKEEKGE